MARKSVAKPERNESAVKETRNYPGKKVLYWVGGGPGGTMTPVPAELWGPAPGYKGKWSVFYVQLGGRVSWSVITDFSETPKVHCWTEIDCYFDWLDSQPTP